MCVLSVCVCVCVLSPPITKDFMRTLLSVGITAESLDGSQMRPEVWNTSVGSHGILRSGIKGGNTPGIAILLAVAEAGAGAGAGAGALGQPGMRSPWFTSVYE